ncbi:MAG: acyl-CoA thioesterase [Candidatus Marinimicrobia bacterium]|nr:acyl-CoA thioesterase [Candidatus Neomarinimicrobiota bacterium]
MTDQNKTTIEMTLLMTPDKVNFSGKVHGGEILKLLDSVAYSCAARYSGHYVVTLTVDHVLFKEPINVGDLVTFYASVNYVGRTSMEIGIKVMAEDLKSNQTRHCNSCYFTMVAMDEKGKPVEVPKLAVETDEQKRRYENAIARRQKS